MPTTRISEVLQLLRGTLLPDGAHPTDAQLLDAFVRHREQRLADLQVLADQRLQAASDHLPCLWRANDELIHLPSDFGLLELQ